MLSSAVSLSNVQPPRRRVNAHASDTPRRLARGAGARHDRYAERTSSRPRTTQDARSNSRRLLQPLDRDILVVAKPAVVVVNVPDEEPAGRRSSILSTCSWSSTIAYGTASISTTRTRRRARPGTSEPECRPGFAPHREWAVVADVARCIPGPPVHTRARAPHPRPGPSSRFARCRGLSRGRRDASDAPARAAAEDAGTYPTRIARTDLPTPNPPRCVPAGPLEPGARWHRAIRLSRRFYRIAGRADTAASPAQSTNGKRCAHNCIRGTHVVIRETFAAQARGRIAHLRGLTR